MTVIVKNNKFKLKALEETKVEKYKRNLYNIIEIPLKHNLEWIG